MQHFIRLNEKLLVVWQARVKTKNSPIEANRCEEAEATLQNPRNPKRSPGNAEVRNTRETGNTANWQRLRGTHGHNMQRRRR